MEAALFFHYLRDGRLMSFTESQEWLTFEARTADNAHAEMGVAEDASNLFPLTIGDYVLGVADLTGELMRRAVNAVGNGNRTIPFSLLHFLRDVQTCFVALKVAGNHLNRGVQNKVKTLNECVSKVERVCYNVKIREAEVTIYN